jgi:hypothetical protein
MFMLRARLEVEVGGAQLKIMNECIAFIAYEMNTSAPAAAMFEVVGRGCLLGAVGEKGEAGDRVMGSAPAPG